jgi:DNA-binding NarL/FixJ family response regulator
MTPATAGLVILMADDHLVVTHGIRLLLRDHVRSVTIVESGTALLAALLVSTPDVVLLDIGMPGISGIETLEALRLLGFTVPVVMLTMHDDEAMVHKALSAGATGYVIKNASGDELVHAIDKASRGEAFVSAGVVRRSPLPPSASHFVPSQAQLAVVRLAAAGMRAKQIAVELGISRRTVESHKYALMQQLGVSTTLSLIRRAKECGFI